MNYKEKLKNYSEIIVRHGANVQPGQLVNVAAEIIHRDFVMQIVEDCYRAGAKYVQVDLSDARSERIRYQHASAESLSYVPEYIKVKYDELLAETAANIRIIGSEDPDLISDIDPSKINTVRKARYKAVESFYKEGIGKSKVQWTLAAASTPAWGQKIFPTLDPSQAEAKLWDEIFRICRADQADCLAAWKKHNQVLQSRAQKLSDLSIKTLHFTGPGTDLKVGLSELALWKGGSDRSPRGAEFEPNIPTEECFTTPDWKKTSGKLRATRPFLINGKMIRELELEFAEGEIVDIKAKTGLETFKEYMSSDAGGKRLGEVALVGTDSPIYASGLVYEEILFDENAACHVAIGSAYKFCLKNGANLDKNELERIGCNESTVHTDMMISSSEVNVEAELYNGKKIFLIKQGAWVEI